MQTINFTNSSNDSTNGINMRQDVLCKAIEMVDGWISVVWEVYIDEKSIMVQSSYGPKLRPFFESSISSLGFKRIDDIRNQKLNARCYINRHGEWQVAPENMLHPLSVVSASQETKKLEVVTHVPEKVEPLKPVPLQADHTENVISLTKQTKASYQRLDPHLKKNDTKLLDDLSDMLDKVLEREDLEKRLFNPEGLLDQVKKLKVTVLEESNTRRRHTK